MQEFCLVVASAAIAIMEFAMRHALAQHIFFEYSPVCDLALCFVKRRETF